MKIKKYVARDFRTAIRKAKEEMGRDAIILQTRQIRRSGLLGWIYPPQVEVTVALDDTLQVQTDRNRPRETPAKAQNNNDPVAATADGQVLVQELQKMNGLIGDLRSRLNEIDAMQGLSPEVQQFYDILVHNHVNRQIALNIVNNVASRLPRDGTTDAAWAWDVCLHTLQQYLSEARPIKIDRERKGAVVFLVGPTGVGKTTTIAKLAANMSFVDHKEVALITLDTYRISAAEQLRTFAEIIGIPITVVFDPADLPEAINKYKNRDVIFVDTAGRSPYNGNQMDELREYIDIGCPDEILLVLSITTDSTALVQIYRQFEKIGVDKLIFTKLDETFHYGPILNIAYEVRKPIAYITTGQNVPDDIEVPDTLKLARMILKGVESHE